MMHIIIAGRRDFNGFSVVEKEVMTFIGKYIGKLEIEIISGDGSNLEISPVYENINSVKPKDQDNKPKNIVIPKEKK